MTADRVIRWSTALAVIGVAAVAAVASYEHAYDLVRAHGESGWTARMVPLTVDGLIYASSMVMLDSVRRKVPVPALARWLLCLGVAATLAASVVHGLGHGPSGAVVAAWPAVALVGSYELLMVGSAPPRRPCAGKPAGSFRRSRDSIAIALYAELNDPHACRVEDGRSPNSRLLSDPRARPRQPQGWKHHTMRKGFVSGRDLSSRAFELWVCVVIWSWRREPQVRDMDQVSEGQGLPIGHGDEIALTSTFAVGGFR
jgi:hypothetical protein